MNELPSFIAESLGREPREAKLFERALTHGSHGRDTYERLEFLGDRVLGLVIAEALLAEDRTAAEGQLAPRLNSLVRKETCAEVATEIDLGVALRMGRSEMLSGGRRKTALLGDAMEAVIAAVYLDGGLEEARSFVLGQLEEPLRLALDATEPVDFKSSLQVLTQKELGCMPVYRVQSEEGPDHEKRFLVELRIGDRVRSKAWGRSKKQAEQEAARQCWTELQGPSTAAIG
jgi:ribonuclease-3